MDDNNKTKPNSISIITFNIQFENPIDCFRNNINSWNNRKAHVVSLLKSYNTDIICLQECTFPQLNYIKDKLSSEYDCFGQTKDKLNWSDINPIFFRKNNYDLLKSGTSWYSDTADIPNSKTYGNFIPRTYTWTLLKCKKSSDCLFIVNTHLDPFIKNAKLKSADQLMGFMKNVCDWEHKLMFLAGDFNSLKNDPIFDLINDSDNHGVSFIDSNKHCEIDDDKFKGTFNNFDCNYGYRIDYVLYSDKENVYNNGNYSVIEDMRDDGNYISDHFPVVVELFK